MDGRCHICNRYDHLQEHHVFFGTANRKVSDKNGFTVYICYDCHQGSPQAVHNCRETDLMLKREAQEKYEETHTREDFMKLIGRNYL